MTLVVDASVAVHWFIDVLASERAYRLIASPDRLIAPDLVMAEIASALWKAVRFAQRRRQQPKPWSRPERLFTSSFQLACSPIERSRSTCAIPSMTASISLWRRHAAAVR